MEWRSDLDNGCDIEGRKIRDRTEQSGRSAQAQCLGYVDYEGCLH